MGRWGDGVMRGCRGDAGAEGAAAGAEVQRRRGGEAVQRRRRGAEGRRGEDLPALSGGQLAAVEGRGDGLDGAVLLEELEGAYRAWLGLGPGLGPGLGLELGFGFGFGF